MASRDPSTKPRRRALLVALCALPMALLVACGGSDGGVGIDAGGRCSSVERKAFLQTYFGDWYFWTFLSPKPMPPSASTVDAYFSALLYNGSDANFPADRWSGYESTESFNRFFGDGQNMGYGIFVTGVEARTNPERGLQVRYTEPLSPAALAGLVRGDDIISINGVPVASLIASDDYSVLMPSAAGTALNLLLRSGGVQRSVTLSAASYGLTPVVGAKTLASPAGRRVGYLLVKDMISQTSTGLAAAFANFRAQGVQDLVLDLRYNGGGLVSAGANLASYVVGGRASGQVYANLVYNSQHSASNSIARFSLPADALAMTRVYVLSGPRTCSAAEQVVNGLRPLANVVLVGDTTCGKPVGFNPRSDNCGTTYSVVTFESTNSRGEGRYFDGLAPTCTATDDVSQALGAAGESLLATALSHADTGSCPAAGGLEKPKRRTPGAAPWREPGERQGMLAR